MVKLYAQMFLDFFTSNYTCARIRTKHGWRKLYRCKSSAQAFLGPDTSIYWVLKDKDIKLCLNIKKCSVSKAKENSGNHNGSEEKHTSSVCCSCRNLITMESGRPFSPHHIKLCLGSWAAAHSNNDDSFHNYKNLLHQANFVQNANFYAREKMNNVIILSNECKCKEILFGIRLQLVHLSCQELWSQCILARLPFPSEP